MRILPILFLLMLVGCQPTFRSKNTPPPEPAPAPRPAAWDLDYSKWKKVLDHPFMVESQLWLMCDIPKPKTIAAVTETEAKTHGPHAAKMIQLFVQPEHAEAFKQKKPMPVGSVIVKEKIAFAGSQDAPVAVAAMIKREPGYDPNNGDWEYVFEDRSDPKEKKLSRGKLSNCIDCHRLNKEEDYLFRSYVTAKSK